MKKLPFQVIVFLGFIPFLFKIPYMVSAWRHSMIDRLDWIFLLMFAVLFTATVIRMHGHRRRFNFYFIGILVLALGIYGAGLAKNINAVSIIGGVIFAWGMIGVVCGKNWAYMLFPAFMILLLCATSSTYWIEYYSNLNGFFVKLGGALLMTAWSIWNILCKRAAISIFEVFFAVALLGLCIFYYEDIYLYEVATRFRPQMSDFSKVEQYIGRKVDVSTLDRRFFGQSRIERYYFAGDNSHSFHVLVASKLENVHKIHPAGHCLRTGGLDVLSNKLSKYKIKGQDRQFNEIVVEANGQKMLFFVWYSNDRLSSGNFLFFRRKYNPDQGWHTYQVSTPIFNDDVEKARSEMLDFLSVW